MLAIITSIGEPTTEVCRWAVERNGFKVIVRQDGSTLWQKLKWICDNVDEDFVRIDADVIVNRSLNAENVERLCSELQPAPVWVQYLTFDMFKMDLAHGGVQFIRKSALPTMREHIREAQYKERPESYLFRLAEFHNPRICTTQEIVMGLNGYGIKDIKRVKMVKAQRGQLANYDFELAEKLVQLL